MADSDRLKTNAAGAAAFGLAGFLAVCTVSVLFGLIASKPWEWSEILSSVLYCTLAAMFSGACFGPLLSRQHPSRTGFTGLLVTYCSGVLLTILVTIIDNVERSVSFPSQEAPYALLLAALAIGLLILIPIFPFGLLGARFFTMLIPGPRKDI